MKKEYPGARRLEFPLVFLLLAAGIVTVGWLYCRNYEKQFRIGIERQISVIADLKAEDLTQYRKERLEDGSMFFQNAPFAALVRRFLKKPEDAEVQRQIQTWLGNCRPYYDEVRLLDPQGVTCLSSPGGGLAVSACVAKGLPDVLRSGQVTIQDFYRSEHDQRIHLGVLVPIFDEQDAHRPLGVFFLRIDPETYLYPFIKRWPAASLTAETLLVRREGNEAVFLNELRFQTNSALNLRRPLDRRSLPAAQAALGREGFMEGSDYRGVRVVAVLRSIPDSPWSLVARMDAAEAFAPMTRQLWQVAVMTGALLFGAAAFISLLWWQQRVRFHRDEARSTEALRVSEVRYRRLFEAAQDGTLILNTETGMVIDVNPYLIKLLGYSREAFLGKKIWELGFLKDIVANLSISASNPLENLQDFLDDLMLDSERKEEEQEIGDAVTLITVHSCKGLEFPHVHIVGLEDGLMPHSRSKVEGTMDEERRLFYVAITRAMLTLTLSHCVARKKFGSMTPCHPSPFLHEIPPELLESADEKSKQPVSVESGKNLFAAMRLASGN